MHSKENHQQSEKMMHRMGENIWKWRDQQEFNLQNIQTTHTALGQKTNKQTKKLNQKVGRNLHRHFSEEDIHIVKKHIKKCSTSLIIREMQINTTMRHHFTQVRMPIIKKSTKNKCWRGCVKKRTLLTKLVGMQISMTTMENSAEIP